MLFVLFCAARVSCIKKVCNESSVACLVALPWMEIGLNSFRLTVSISLHFTDNSAFINIYELLAGCLHAEACSLALPCR